MIVRTATAATGTRNEDRCDVFPLGEGTAIVVADGAGGVGGGRKAADLCLRVVRESLAGAATGLRDDGSRGVATPSPAPGQEAVGAALERADAVIHADPVAGWTTGIAAIVVGDRVYGANVGDSGAWIVGATGAEDLVRGHPRKPLLGTGEAIPVMFGPVPLIGPLVVATDGIRTYVPRPRFLEVTRAEPPDRWADALVEAARLPSGTLQDDAAVVVCIPAG